MFFLGRLPLFASVLFVYRLGCCGVVVSFRFICFLLCLLDVGVVWASCVWVVFGCCGECFDGLSFGLLRVFGGGHVV